MGAVQRSSCLLALFAAGAVLLPTVATAESWSTEDGTPGQGRVSSAFPGRDLGVKWRAADTNPGSASDPQGPVQCVLVDEQRVYAVHNDPAQSSMGRLIALDRATGVRLWRTPLYPLASLDRHCPVLAGDQVIGPVAFNQSTGDGPFLRAWSTSSGSVAWSQPASPTSSLSSDGTRVFGATVEDEGCPTYAWAAWTATTGTREWCTNAGSAFQATPPVVADSAVVVGHPSGTGLTALDPTDGGELWADTNAAGPGSVATRTGRVAYATNDLFGDDGVRVRDADTGSVAWSRTFPAGEIPNGVALADEGLYVRASLQGSGNSQLRVRALDPSDGTDIWDAPIDQLPQGGVNTPHVLGDRVVVDDLAIDRTTGVAQPGYTAWSLPRRAAFVDGTIYGWTQGDDSTWSVTAVSDIEPPLVSGLDPASGTLTTDQTPTVTFSVDDGLGRGLAAAEVLLDGSSYDVTGVEEWTPATPLADGTYTWAVRATDAAGNSATTTPREITVDSTPPTAFAVTAPAGVVTTGLPQIRWEAATDATSGVDHYEVAVDGEVLGTRPGDCGPTCSFTPGPLIADGSHTLEIIAIDRVGLTRSSGVLDLTVAAPPRTSLLREPQIVLTGNEVLLDASASWDNDPGELSYEWRVDDGPFVAGPAERPVTFDTAGLHTVTVRVTGAGGLSATQETDVDVRPTPPDGAVGIVVNDGAYATNDRRVTVSVVWRPLDRTVRLAREDEFRTSLGALTFDLQPTLTWQLEGSGAQTVFARLAGKPDAGARDLSDTIVVDTAAPEVVSAALVSSTISGRLSTDAVPQRTTRTVRVRITASDGRSGVRAYQVTGDRDQPGTAVKVQRTKAFRDTVRASVSGSTVWVRVIDAAGNRSAWVRAR